MPSRYLACERSNGRVASIWAAAFLSLLTAASLLAGSQQQNSLFLPQKHQVDVRLVLVDVIATRGGEFYPGLKKENFRLFDDKNEVEINSCELISLGRADVRLAPEIKAAVPVIAEKKRLAVLFDGVSAWDREFKKTAQQISDEIAPLAKSDVDVMVLFLDREKGLRIVQPFTDQEALIRNAMAMSAGSVFSPTGELIDYNDILFAANYANADLPAGAGVDLAPITEMRALEHTNSARDKLTREVGGLLASLHFLETLPGRKNLLFVSSGISDLEAFRAENSMTRTENISIFDPFGILGQQVFRSSEDIITEIIRVANDRNVSIYTLDPSTFSKSIFRGVSAEYFDRETANSERIQSDEKYRQTQNLKILAENTGASFLRGANKIESFREVVRNDISYYYQLSYYPAKDRETQGYHKIRVRLKGVRNVQLRFREGYSDTPAEASKRLVLARAFYDPDSFMGKLPFRAEFVPLALDSGKSQPWMNIALPAREFFKDRFAGYGNKAYELHFWIRGEEQSERVLAGSVSIPLDMPTINDRLSSLDFIRLHFSGPAVSLPDGAYQVVFALFDPESGEIGTWRSNYGSNSGNQEPSLLNGVLGNVSVAGQKNQDATFSLSNKDGALECGSIRFFPKIAGGVSRGEATYFFLQAYCPGGKPDDTEFALADGSSPSKPVRSEKTVETWNERSKIWSAVFRLDLLTIPAGDGLLKLEISGSGGSLVLAREIKLRLS